MEQIKTEPGEMIFKARIRAKTGTYSAVACYLNLLQQQEILFLRMKECPR